MPDNEIPVKITGDSSSLKQATDDAKDQLEKAGKSVEMLGDLIGLKIPDAIKDMIASSELIGPALSEAFAPLALLTAGIELFNQLSDKIKEVTNDMEGWDASAKDIYADLVKNNAELARFNETLEIQKLHLSEVGKTGVAKLTEQIKNNGAAVAIWNRELGEANANLAHLQGTTKVNFGIDEMSGAPIDSDISNKDLEKDEIKKANWDKDIEKQEAKRTELTEKIKQAQLEEQQLNKKKDAQEIQEDITANEQILAAKKQQADAEHQLAVDTAHAEVQQGKITAAQEESIILASFQKERDATIKYLQDRQALLLTGVAKGSAEEKAINETTAIQIHDADVKYQDQTIKVVGNAAAKWKALREKVAKDIKAIADKAAKDEQAASDKATRESIANAEKETQARIKAANEKMAVAEKELEGEIIAAQGAEQVQEATLAKELAQHKITKQQEIEGVKDAKLKEINQEIIYLQQIQSLYDKGTQKWQEVQNRIIKIQAEAAKVREKAAADEANVTNQEYQKLWSAMGGSFKSFADSIMQGNQTIAQDFQKLYTSLLQAFIGYLEQKYAKQLSDAIQQRFFKKEQASDDIGTAASTGGAWAFADMASTGPEGLALAPEVAASTSSTIEGFEAGVMSSAGGDWRVDRDRLNFVHANETILPASIAGKLRNMVEGGGSNGSPTVVVNHTVQAVDASSFQQHIRRHSNMIANEVTRALKRKA